MRKPSYLFILITFYSLLVSVLILTHPIKTYAYPDDTFSEEAVKFLPRFLCLYFELANCESINSTPDPNTPDPTYPTPELLQTPIPTKPGSCAQPGGRFLCGSRAVPLAGCGHCGLGYPASQQKANCDNGKAETWGTAYAIDVSLKPYEPVFLPSIEGQTVTWTFYAERKYSDNAIQRYRGIANGKTFVVQFHHTQIGSGIGIGKTATSGQIGAKVCPSCDHTHIQIMQGNSWKSATSYYCLR